MYFASLKLPKHRITSYADAINSLPLGEIAIHDSFDAAQEHLHHQGLVYKVELNPEDIYNNPRLNSNMIKVGAIKAFKQVDVFADRHLSFSPTEENIARLRLIAMTHELDIMMTRIDMTNYHDFSLPDYLQQLLGMLTQICEQHPEKQALIEDSLHHLNNFLEGRLSYLDFKANIKHLGLSSSSEEILYTLGKCLLVCSLIFFPSLYFAQVLSAGVCLGLGAVTGILGLGLFSRPKSQELAYEDQLSHLCEINPSINQQLGKYFNAEVPQITFWGPQLV